MLLFTRKALPKPPKRRSRAGCVHCKEKKKKCNEKRPQCDRCTEKGIKCEYEAVKPRKRRRTLTATSPLSPIAHGSPMFFNGQWQHQYDHSSIQDDDIHEFDEWNSTPAYQQYSPSDIEGAHWQDSFADDDENVEEIIRDECADASTGHLVRSRNQYPDLAMIAPSPVASPLLEFCAPVFVEFSDKRSRRVLIDHFCNVLSHLIVFKEDTGNPFRQLVLPLSHTSSPVMNAIFALSSAHLEYKGIENEEKSLDFHNRALQGLAQLIELNDMNHREEVLGAIMLLVYYEVLVQRGSSNIVNGHLKGAMTIMKSGPQVTSPAGLFLERAFRFYDVIAALSYGTPPNTSSQPSTTPFAYSTPFGSAPNSPLNAVDTLLGLSTDLWPIIHRLSHLLSFKQSLEAAVAACETSKATVLRTELESTCQAIEFALQNWKPMKSTSSSPKDLENLIENSDQAETTRIQSILNNAEAYRHSAFVYLYRTIKDYPRSHFLVQKHAHLSLIACTNVVDLAAACDNGPMSALLWPLFAAACEALTEEDRALATKAFSGVEKRQGMNNIMRAWEVVQEVWRRVDYEAFEGRAGDDVYWRNICGEMGLNIVFG
ncbi:fungal-specific transcription factor domain-containing protein [Xylogone sp. PMI_703]|nr:fungal-specific transcription factor domain-containing protein [Xylogone sp. PMI_703]